MRKTQWITPITFRRGTAVILLLALLACAIPAGADTAPKNDIDNMTGETQIILAEAALQMIFVVHLVQCLNSVAMSDAEGVVEIHEQVSIVSVLHCHLPFHRFSIIVQR